MKKTAIMQPYFLPYIGYWQLVQSVDEFVVYDNIEFTKKGWFNRNRILDGDHDRLFTIPIKKDSDFLPVGERYRSVDSGVEIARILRIIQNTYRKAPQYALAYPLIEACFLSEETNLFRYIYNSICLICDYIHIDTQITISSAVPIDHTLKAEHKVLALCRATATDMYINSIGGVGLYDKDAFASQGVDLKFIKSRDIVYKQLGNRFVPWLSIIDILMFNDRQKVTQMLGMYELL